MPFEPLQTDEPISGPIERKKDFEAQLMAGCTTIGVVSLLTYGLSVWPFTLFPEYTVDGLVGITLSGPLSASVLGGIAGRKFGLAGASGFFGGALAGAVFMHLRLQQTLLGRYARDLPKPEYPDYVAWWYPVLWFLWAGALAVVFCKREAPAP